MVIFLGRNVDFYMLSIVQNNKILDDENSTILWEPGSRTTPVYYSGVDARIIATLRINIAFMSSKRRQKCFLCLSK